MKKRSQLLREYFRTASELALYKQTLKEISRLQERGHRLHYHKPPGQGPKSYAPMRRKFPH